MSRGFTLIETLVALLLLGLLSGAAMLSYRQPLAAARIDTAMATIRQFDAATRVAARVSGRPQRMVFDWPRHRLQRIELDNGPAVRAQAALGGDGRLWIEGQSQADGPVSLDVTPEGWCRPYTVQMGGHLWAVAGLSGQVLERP